jgi:anti-sigma B factor antagonist
MAMELKIHKNADNYIIDVNGGLDLYSSFKLTETVTRMLEKKIENFIINLDNVEYMDSSGLGALISICSTIKKRNFKLVITNIHGAVKEEIELTQLMGCFSSATSIEEALRQLEG